MAKEKPAATTEELLGKAPSVITVEPDERNSGDDIDASKIDAILTSSDVQNGGKIRMERRGPADQVFQYICKIATEDFDIERIKKVYGGGDYKCQTFRANGQMYKPFNFSIDYRFKGSLDDTQIKLLSQDNGEMGKMADRQTMLISQLMSSRNSNSEMMQLFQLSSERSDRMFQMMMQQAAEAQKSTATIIAACMASRGNGMDPMVMELLKSQINRPTSSPTDPAAQLGLMKELLGLAREMTGPVKEKEESSMVEKVLNAALPLVEKWAGGRPAVSTRPVQLPAVPVTPSTPSQPDGVQEFAKMVNAYLSQIVSAAERNADPALYADIILDALPPEKLQDVIEILTRDDWRVILFNNDARVIEHAAWFEELRQLILSNGNDASGTGAAQSSNIISAGQPSDGPSADTQGIGKTPSAVSN